MLLLLLGLKRRRRRRPPARHGRHSGRKAGTTTWSGWCKIAALRLSLSLSLLCKCWCLSLWRRIEPKDVERKGVVLGCMRRSRIGLAPAGPVQDGAAEGVCIGRCRPATAACESTRSLLGHLGRLGRRLSCLKRLLHWRLSLLLLLCLRLRLLQLRRRRHTLRMMRKGRGQRLRPGAHQHANVHRLARVLVDHTILVVMVHQSRGT